jgi:hypothetical protein
MLLHGILLECAGFSIYWKRGVLASLGSEGTTEFPLEKRLIFG